MTETTHAEVEMVSRARAKAILGVSLSSLQRYEKEGRLTPHRTGKRKITYPLAEVMAIKAGAANAPSDVRPRPNGSGAPRGGA